MRIGAICSAAIEVLADIEARHRPATDALRDWGLSHRFAGSGDRGAIGNLVFDALRRRSSLAWLMGSDTPRALVLGTFGILWKQGTAGIDAAFSGDPHAPEPLTADERAALERDVPDDAPSHVRGDYPDWLDGSLTRLFGEAAAEEGRALAARAPVDLRANPLKSSREKVLKALSRVSPAPTPFAPYGIRVPVGEGAARSPHVLSEPGYRKGWFEVQDEGSQLAALLAGAAPGMQVADICAGAGGKTLALAAQMANKGQVYAWDADRRRLADIHERLQRGGVRNAQVREAGNVDALADLAGRMDVVLVDAPCSGSGVWRRRPDAKWRLSDRALAERIAEQTAALEAGAPMVKPGGRLVYVTCSLLPEENEDRVADFLAGHPDFAAISSGEVLAAALPGDAGERLAEASLSRPGGVMFTPRLTGTDGFFVSVLERLGGSGQA